MLSKTNSLSPHCPTCLRVNAPACTNTQVCKMKERKLRAITHLNLLCLHAPALQGSAQSSFTISHKEPERNAWISMQIPQPPCAVSVEIIKDLLLLRMQAGFG
ncbi:hypothetical protein GOODEAATRI_016288 [Goodea atripinnis]|uniref:Uncharacterized protein n=1 Tax=Goodea atripinnis TaxID=208336 RepID=A0ABV0P5L3_9TELE